MSFEEIIDILNDERTDAKFDLTSCNEEQELLDCRIEFAKSEIARVDADLARARSDFNDTVEKYAELVVRGVNFLNGNAKGWAKPDKISITDLELDNSHMCVLGQLAAKSALRSAGWDLTRPDWDTDSTDFEYSDALRAFKKEDEDWDEYEHGFDWTNDAHVGATLGDNETGYEILNHLWAEAIRLRRGKKKVTAQKLAKAVRI